MHGQGHPRCTSCDEPAIAGKKAPTPTRISQRGKAVCCPPLRGVGKDVLGGSGFLDLAKLVSGGGQAKSVYGDLAYKIGGCSLDAEDPFGTRLSQFLSSCDLCATPATSTRAFCCRKRGVRRRPGLASIPQRCHCREGPEDEPGADPPIQHDYTVQFTLIKEHPLML